MKGGGCKVIAVIAGGLAQQNNLDADVKEETLAIMQNVIDDHPGWHHGEGVDLLPANIEICQRENELYPH